MGVERKYERDIDLLLAEEFSASHSFAAWFLGRTKGFKGVNAKVADVYVSRSDTTGESDLVVVYEKLGGDSRFALLIEDKIDAPLQPEQEARYRLRGEAEIRRGDYSEFEVILCSPEAYPRVHTKVATFDAFVTYEAISDFLSSQGAEDPRSRYRANFVATAAKKNSNTYTRVDDAVTNAFWERAFEIATRDFPDLEMQPLTVTKDSTWLNFRPLDMPTQPRRIYISFNLNYARRRNRCWLVEGATPFGTPENSALKQLGPRSSELREPILRSHPNGERSTTGYLPNARQSRGSCSYFTTQ